MSGHSKWSTIKRKKGANDAKRGKIFTKLIREISTAARLGGADLDANSRLRLVVDKAKAANMPKDNIERAIQKGVGGGETEAFEECVYEGYGPAGVAVMVEALTDNRNRTVGDIRHLFNKHGGNLGANGCVSYLFEKRGLLVFDAASVDGEVLMEAAIEAGAEDVEESEDTITVVTSASELHAVGEALAVAGFEPEQKTLDLAPTTTVKVVGKDAQTLLTLADALEDLDDVQSVYANFDIPEEELAALA